MATVLVWLGSGFAFSVGVYFGARVLHRGNTKLEEKQQEVNDLLAQRNHIGLRQAEALEEIVKALRLTK